MWGPFFSTYPKQHCSDFKAMPAGESVRCLVCLPHTLPPAAGHIVGKGHIHTAGKTSSSHGTGFCSEHGSHAPSPAVPHKYSQLRWTPHITATQHSEALGK